MPLSIYFLFKFRKFKSSLVKGENLSRGCAKNWRKYTCSSKSYYDPNNNVIL
jgi:hypothetical protein